MMKVDVRMFVISTAKFCFDYKQVPFLFSLGKIITEHNYIVIFKWMIIKFEIVLFEFRHNSII